MSEIKSYLEKCAINYDIDESNFKIYKIQHPALNEEYGVIRIVKVEMSNEDALPLVVVPGYSYKSFCGITKILLENIDDIKDKFSNLHIVSFSDEIKKLSQDIVEGITDTETQYAKNEEFRIEISKILDKILRSPDLGLDKYALLGKSAGGGISTHIAGMHVSKKLLSSEVPDIMTPEVEETEQSIIEEETGEQDTELENVEDTNPVKILYLACPATTSRGANLKFFQGKIKLSWNEDDEMIPSSVAQEFIDNFEENNNDYESFMYKEGGHELNPDFLKEL